MIEKFYFLNFVYYTISEKFRLSLVLSLREKICAIQ